MTHEGNRALGVAACAVIIASVLVCSLIICQRWQRDEAIRSAASRYVEVNGDTALWVYLIDVLDELGVDHSGYASQIESSEVEAVEAAAARGQTLKGDVDVFFERPESRSLGGDFWLTIPRTLVGRCRALDRYDNLIDPPKPLTIDSTVACEIAAKRLSSEGMSLDGRQPTARLLGDFWVVRYPAPSTPAGSQTAVGVPPATTRVIISKRTGAALVCVAPSKLTRGQ